MNPELRAARMQKAGRGEIADVLAVLDEVAAWLGEQGMQQWPPRFERAWTEPAIVAGDTWLAVDDEHLLATVTLERADDLWADRPASAALAASGTTAASDHGHTSHGPRSEALGAATTPGSRRPCAHALDRHGRVGQRLVGEQVAHLRDPCVHELAVVLPDEPAQQGDAFEPEQVGQWVLVDHGQRP